MQQYIKKVRRATKLVYSGQAGEAPFLEVGEEPGLARWRQGGGLALVIVHEYTSNSIKCSSKFMFFHNTINYVPESLYNIVDY